MKRFNQRAILLLASVLLCLPVVASASGAADQAADTRVVADVGGQPILAADLQTKLAAERRRDIAVKRLDSFGSAAKEKTLDRLVDTKRLTLAARQRKLDERPEVKRQIENLVDELLAAALLVEVATSVPQTDEALHKYYDNHLDEFQIAGRVRARHIVVKTQPEAVSLLGKLKRHADFESVAREHNIDSTKETGGELGWVKRGVMVELFEKTLFSLKVGEISPIVQTAYGFHIIRVEEIEAPKTKPFESVSGDVKQKAIERGLQIFKQKLAQELPAKIHTEVLKSIP